MKKIRITWSNRAQRNLREIRDYIAKDKEIAAQRFISQLKQSVTRLRNFPRAGWVVEEFDDPAIRETVHGNYRILYSFDGVKIEILTVRHAARLLRGKDLEGE